MTPLKPKSEALSRAEHLDRKGNETDETALPLVDGVQTLMTSNVTFREILSLSPTFRACFCLDFTATPLT